MKRILSAVLFTTLTIPAMAFADGYEAKRQPPRIEIPSQLPGQMQGDRREIRDDKDDVADLKALANRYDIALRGGMFRAIRHIEGLVITEVREELAENTPGRGNGHAFGRHRRDDDRDDRKVAREIAARRQQILADFEALAGRMQPRALYRKKTLIAELVTLAQKELAESREERREDKRDDRRDDRRPGRGW
jgi:hypothetical protein